MIGFCEFFIFRDECIFVCDELSPIGVPVNQQSITFIALAACIFEH